MLLRWLLGVCSIRVLAKNHCDPYYEPTIVVHNYGTAQVTKCKVHGNYSVLHVNLSLVHDAIDITVRMFGQFTLQP